VATKKSSRTHLIIGATGGIGSALARRLAARGDRLILAARNETPLQALADELNARAVPADVTSFDGAEQLIDEAGAIDSVVNLVGSIIMKPAHLTSEDELRETLDLNIVSAFAVVRAAAKTMRSSGGSIVLMSSCAATTGLVNHEAIAAAKAAVEGLTRSAAATYAANNLRINAVAPGLVDTPMSKRITSNETALKASTAMHPLGRIGQPDEVAATIEWLLNGDADWITGQVIGVDGGLARVRPRASA